MKKPNKAAVYLSLLLLALLLICIDGVLSQFIINTNNWKLSGGDYRTAPALPSLKIAEVLSAVFSFPEGLYSLLILAVLVILFIVFILKPDFRGSGSDPQRNLTISKSGSFGTAAFMSRREISECCEIVAPKSTDRDILGMLETGKVLTHPRNSRLNENWAVCGASGTGKSRCISRNLILQAAKREESVIVTDCKGELYDSTSEYLRSLGYTVKIFNLVDMAHSDSWNCLGEINGDELMAQTFVDVVLSNTHGEVKDAFWYSAELNLLKALVLYVSCEVRKESRTFAQVYDMLTSETVDSLEKIMEKVSITRIDAYTGEVLPPSPACAPFSLFKQASGTVQSSVIVGLGSKLQVMQAQLVKDITSYDDIDLELPGKQKCAYFCVVSDQDSTFTFLSSLFFSFLFIRLIRYADAQCKDGMLKTKVRFILDEFTNCCNIPDFTKKASTIRSRGCSFVAFCQNIGQIRNRYPDDQWQEILGACDTTVFLGCTDLLTAEYFSDRAGIASVEVEGTARDLSALRFTNYTPHFRQTNSISRRQLLTPDEILRMPPEDELVFIRGRKVMKLKRFDYSLHPAYEKLRPTKANLHEPQWSIAKRQTQAANAGSSADSIPSVPKHKAKEKKPDTTQANANREYVHVDVQQILKKGR